LPRSILGISKRVAPVREAVPSRRRSSTEAIPAHGAVEVAHSPERTWERWTLEEDLVGCPSTIRAVRPVAVVELHEVCAEAVDLREASEKPDVPEDGLLEGAEDAFDAAVGPRVGRAGAGVLDAAGGEKELEVEGSELWPVVGEQTPWQALVVEGALQRSSYPGGGRQAALECQKPAAVIVDDAQEPDGEETEKADEGQVEAPELPWLADRDPVWAFPAGVDHLEELALAADQDAADGLAGDEDAENAVGKEAELAAAETEVLCGEAGDGELDVFGGAVVGPLAAGSAEGLGGQGPSPQEPAAVQQVQGAAGSAPAGETLQGSLAPVVDAQREAKGRADEEVGEVIDRSCGEAVHFRMLGDPKVCRGGDPGTLFLTSNGVAFNPEQVTHIVRAYMKTAGIEKPGACHLFRHTAATLMLEGGADVRYVQELLGHASLEATQVYTQVSIKRLKEVHTRTHPDANLVTGVHGASEALESEVEAIDPKAALMATLDAEVDEEES
jgi:hypothetical protein